MALLTILQVFNNNVALVELAHHRQAVAKGSGIVFGKHKGDAIPAKKVDKLFILDTEVSKKNLYFLLKDIPIDVVTTTYEIIDVAQRQYHLKVLDYLYITLSDHLYSAYKRYKDGSYEETQVPDFHIQYPAEYAVAKRALQIIRVNLGVAFPMSEANNLALHFINAIGKKSEEQPFEQKQTVTLNQLVHQVLKQHGILRATTNGNYYDRFMIHLEYLVDRLQTIEPSGAVIEPQLAGDLRRKYPRSYQIASEIYDRVKAELYPNVSEDERLYFIIHIQRLIHELPVKNH